MRVTVVRPHVVPPELRVAALLDALDWHVGARRREFRLARRAVRGPLREERAVGLELGRGRFAQVGHRRHTFVRRDFAATEAARIGGAAAALGVPLELVRTQVPAQFGASLEVRSENRTGPLVSHSFRRLRSCRAWQDKRVMLMLEVEHQLRR